jgi:2-keto-3-deoxy-L-rhamnonate aldolase RhmA
MGARLKQALSENRVVRVIGMGQLCSPKLVEMIGFAGGWDAVWLDQEHGGLSISRIEEACRAARSVGLDSFVRLTATDYATVMRPLEAGGGGIMAAMVRSARQAEEIVRWAKFHPQGCRGINGSGVDGRYGTLPMKEYLAKANAETFIAIQIEHVDAVNEVDRIAAISGVDVLFVGPADLSQSMGHPGEWEHAVVWDALRKVSAAAKQHGIHWAILAPTPDYARRCVELGCRMLGVGMDVWLISKGLAAFKHDYADYFG